MPRHAGSSLGFFMPSAVINTSLVLAAFFLGTGAVLVAIGWRLLWYNRTLLEENRRLLNLPEPLAARHRADPWGWWLKPVFASAVLLPGIGLTVSPLLSRLPDPPVLTDLPVSVADPGTVIPTSQPAAAELTVRAVNGRAGPEPATRGITAEARSDTTSISERLTWAASNHCRPVSLGEAREIARRAAYREGVSEGLLLAVIFHESRFAPCAVSASGAQGLMQLKPETAWEVGVRNPFDPADNIGGGARYLHELIARYDGDTALALGAYLHGPTVIDRTGRLPPLPATRHYVREIQELADILGPQAAD